MVYATHCEPKLRHSKNRSALQITANMHQLSASTNPAKQQPHQWSPTAKSPTSTSKNLHPYSASLKTLVHTVLTLVPIAAMSSSRP